MIFLQTEAIWKGSYPSIKTSTMFISDHKVVVGFPVLHNWAKIGKKMCNFLVSQKWLQLKGFFLFLAYCVLFFHQKKLTFTCMSIWLNNIYMSAQCYNTIYTLFKEWYQKYKKSFYQISMKKFLCIIFFPLPPFWLSL